MIELVSNWIAVTDMSAMMTLILYIEYCSPDIFESVQFFEIWLICVFGKVEFSKFADVVLHHALMAGT